MVSWLPHILIPGLLALAFFRSLPRKWVMAVAPIVWLPDLDIIGGTHRVITHNIWIPAVLLALSWGTWRIRNDGTRWTDSWRKGGWPLAYLLLSYYWASHLLLDIFAGGVLLFWPLSDLNFYAFYEIHLDLVNHTAKTYEEAGTSQGAPQVSDDYAWLSFEHTATLAFLALVGAVAATVKLVRRRRARTPMTQGEGSSEPSKKGK